MPSQSAAGTIPSYTRESPAAFVEPVALLSFTAVESFATALAFPFLLLQLARRAVAAKIIRIFFIRFIFLVAAKVSYFHEKAKDNRIFFFD